MGKDFDDETNKALEKATTIIYNGLLKGLSKC